MNAKNIHFIMKKNYFSRFIWCSVDAGFGSAAGGGCDRRQSTANKITTIEDATAPAPIIIIVDCLCFSCLEISVGGSSDKIVSSILCELADVNATKEKRKENNRNTCLAEFITSNSVFQFIIPCGPMMSLKVLPCITIGG